MKKYTHAWLAMMAMKRIEEAAVDETHKDDADALVAWFKNYRDAVISGAWYPDAVIKDMGTSHILKYESKKDSKDRSFRVMPDTLAVYSFCKDSELKEKPFTITSGNLCDRCESLAERIIDSFKAYTYEIKGTPIIPPCHEIAHVFFMLSHYIADCHMPLHCDARSFYNENEVHALIEELWDEEVRKSYEIDYDNQRFRYDPQGYPLHTQDMTDLMRKVEEESLSREFYWPWGVGTQNTCNNTWDYMSGVSQYSYLMAFKLVPADKTPKSISSKYYLTTEAYKEHFQEYSFMILSDAIESIAKVWLHAWCRYRNWWRGQELAGLKEEKRAADSKLKAAQTIIETYPEDIAAREAKLSCKKGKNLINATNKIESMRQELLDAQNSIETLSLFSKTLELKVMEMTAYNLTFGASTL